MPDEERVDQSSLGIIPRRIHFIYAVIYDLNKSLTHDNRSQKSIACFWPFAKAMATLSTARRNGGLPLGAAMWLNVDWVLSHI